MPALVANAQMPWPVATPAAVARPAARPPARLLRMVMAVSGPGVAITSAEMPRNANKAPLSQSISRIDQDAGIHHPLGIELALGAAQRAGEQLGPLLVIKWPVEAADR